MEGIEDSPTLQAVDVRLFVKKASVTNTHPLVKRERMLPPSDCARSICSCTASKCPSSSSMAISKVVY